MCRPPTDGIERPGNLVSRVQETWWVEYTAAPSRTHLYRSVRGETAGGHTPLSMCTESDIARGFDRRARGRAGVRRWRRLNQRPGRPGACWLTGPRPTGRRSGRNQPVGTRPADPGASRRFHVHRPWGRYLRPRTDRLAVGSDRPRSRRGDSTVNAPRSTLGECPHRDAPIPERCLHIEYEPSDGPGRHAECPECGAVVTPE